MKSIEDLNKKIIYRLIKTIYFILLLLIVFKIGSISFEKSYIYPYNYEKTTITCLVGPNRNDTTNKRFYIPKDRYNITGTLTSEQKEKIAVEVCDVAPTPSLKLEKLNTYSDLFLTNNPVFMASMGVMESKFRIIYFFGNCLIILLAGMVITEILRRIVYYIFLGTFKPEK